MNFRTALEVETAATKVDDPNINRPSEEGLHEMIKKAMRVSGETEKDSWIYSGHPSTMSKIVDKRRE